MNNPFEQVGLRIEESRKALNISVQEMADLHHISVEEYLKHETGEIDSSFSFLYRTSKRLGIDLGSLLTGETPHLSLYTVTRKESSVPFDFRPNVDYLLHAAKMKGRACEPFFVNVPFVSDDEPIHLARHKGQEFDYVLKGRLKVQIKDHVEYISAGESIMYNSENMHGMVAVGGEPCEFLAIILRTDGNLDFTEEAPEERNVVGFASGGRLIYHEFVDETVNERGMLTGLKFHLPENFNFAFDVVDALAQKSPNRIAMRWLSWRGEQRDFTFREMSQESSRAANYLASLGVQRGDKVMLIMKRHHQFWPVINAVHKLGAVAIPASCQLKPHDLEYRFQSADIKAIVCSAEGEISQYVDEVQANCPSLKVKVAVNGCPADNGWHAYDEDVRRFSTHFERNPEQRVSDTMLMFFSSGTTGNPKMVAHDFSYPAGHIATARWWHNVDPNGLHFTISDTGWGKSLWGKIYGQWLCEGAIFTYDFDKFVPAEILPLFKRFNITTFCAPPTMYRFFIKEDLSKYDWSSLKYACTAGEALNPEVFHQFRKATGLEIMEGFGQTESTLLLANLIGTKPKPGSMGRPNPQFDIELLDTDGTPVKAGEKGEICVRADREKGVVGLFSGYVNAPELTDAQWHDGYYHTGDMAWCDEDGCYWYEGRCDDIIKTSGYRVGPFEIESVLMELPYVLECAITGVPDPVRTQVIKATILLVPGTVGTDALKAEIQNYVKARTAPYKYPRIVEFVDEMPKTVSGKIRRAAIRGDKPKA